MCELLDAAFISNLVWCGFTIAPHSFCRFAKYGFVDAWIYEYGKVSIALKVRVLFSYTVDCPGFWDPVCCAGRRVSDQQVNMYLCYNLKTCLPLEQEGLSSRWLNRHVLLANKKTCLLNKKRCLLVQPENMSSGGTRRHAFLFKKETCLLDCEQAEIVWNCGESDAIVLNIPNQSGIVHNTP